MKMKKRKRRKRMRMRKMGPIRLGPNKYLLLKSLYRTAKRWALQRSRRRI